MTRTFLALVTAVLACGPERSADGDAATTGDATSVGDPTTSTSQSGDSSGDGVPAPDVPTFACTLPTEANADVSGHADDGNTIDEPIAMGFAWYGNTGGGRCPPGQHVVFTSTVDAFESAFHDGTPWFSQALTIDVVDGDPTSLFTYERMVSVSETVMGSGTVSLDAPAIAGEPLAGSFVVDAPGLRAEGQFVALPCALLDSPPCP